MRAARLEIVRPQASVLGNARQHARPDFVTVVKREYVIRPSVPLQNAV
jgi:hypothetical protein